MSRRNGIHCPARIASRVGSLGKEISREYRGRRVDVLVSMDRGFVFAADLIRHVDALMVCHYVRTDVRDGDQDGHAHREILFGAQPELKGRDILVVDVVLDRPWRHAGLSSAPPGREPAMFHPLGSASGRARQAARGPGAGITSASGLHLIKQGSAMAWQRPHGTGRNLKELA